MPATLPPPILLRILHHSSTSHQTTISTLAHLWLALRPVCKDFQTEIEDVFLSRYLKDMEIRVAVYSQDVYQTCDPIARLSEIKEGKAVEVFAPRPAPNNDVLFKFSHTTASDTSTAAFTPALSSHEPGSSRDMDTAMALANLSSRFISRLMVKKPTHVVSWYGCVNDVFLPGLKVDLWRGWVEVEWKALVGGFLGEEVGVWGVRRGMVGGGRGRRGLWELGSGGEGGMVNMAGPAVMNGLKRPVHGSATMDLPMAKKRKRNDKEMGKGREDVKRCGRDLINQSASAPSAAPVVIDLDLVRTSTSAPSPIFGFGFDRNLDMDGNFDMSSEPQSQSIPPPPQPLEAWTPLSDTSFSSSFPRPEFKDVGFSFSSSFLASLPFSVSPSSLSSPGTSPLTLSSHTPPQPPSPSPTLYSHHPTFHPLLTPPPPPIPANTLNWDIDPARLEARRRRVAHLYRNFCRDGGRDVGVRTVGVEGNDIEIEMGEEIGPDMEKEMGYRGWIMREWCAVERLQGLRMEADG